jgi:hypothetical protein
MLRHQGVALLTRSSPVHLFAAVALAFSMACARDAASSRSGAAPADTLDARLIVAIGQESGEDAQIIARVFSGFRNARGLVIANGTPPEIRIYDTSGALVQRIGRSGGGPGEFQHLTWIAALGDSIAALDAHALRISIFDASGRFARAIRIDAAEYGGAEWLGVVDAGFALGIARRADPRQLAPGGMARDSFSVVVVSAIGEAGAISPSIGGAWWQRLASATDVRIRMLESGPRALVTQGAGQLLLSASDSPTALRLLASRWDTVQIAAPSGTSSDTPQPVLRTEIVAGPSREIWIADTLVTPDAMRRWQVLDAAGMPRAVLQLPASLSLWAVGADWLLGKAVTPESVEQVQLWTLVQRP